MDKSQKQVREFHDTFGVPVADKPTMISDERLQLRAQLILEEVIETIEGMGCSIGIDKAGEYIAVRNHHYQPDMVKIADGLTDTRYVVNGAALELGIDLENTGDEVHRSNMTKLWSTAEWEEAALSGRVAAEGLTCKMMDLPKGQSYFRFLVVKRADGKVVKPVGYSPADIKGVLEGHGK